MLICTKCRQRDEPNANRLAGDKHDCGGYWEALKPYIPPHLRPLNSVPCKHCGREPGDHHLYEPLNARRFSAKNLRR